MSAKFNLNLKDLVAIGKGGGVAGGGAAAAAILIENFKVIADYASTHIGTWGIVVALLSILVNVGRRFLSGGEDEKVDVTSPAA